MDVHRVPQMHHQYWGLREAPFRSGFHAKFYHRSTTHAEALARIEFLVGNGRSCGLLHGGPGSGKSLLLRAFAEQCRRSNRMVGQVSLLGLNEAGLLHSLSLQMGVEVAPVHSSPFLIWRKLTDALSENAVQQIPTVLLVDDAHEGDLETLSTLTRLLQCQQSMDAYLTLVLAADSQRIGALGPRLLDLAELRVELEVWDEAATRNFLQAALATAGGSGDILADDAALRIHELSGGSPRKAAQLAELALLAGAASQLKQIDEFVIDSVYQELAVMPARTMLQGA